jgi:carboxyl-terminal processing protease
VNRALRVGAAVAAVGTAFAGGTIFGATSHDSGPAKPSVVDEAASRIAGDSSSQVNVQKLQQSAIQAMLAQTGDRWAAYYAPQERAQLSALLDGRYGGLGLWLRRASASASSVSVVSIVPGSPATTKVQVGDQVLAVGSWHVGGSGVAEVVTKLRGPSGSPVTLTLRRKGVTRHVRLTRADVTTPDVAVSAINQHIELIRISSFSRGVGIAVRDGVAALGHKSAQGIILDLRGDPGGLLDEAVEVAGVFLNGGPVVSYSGRSMPTRVLDAPSGGATKLPVAVLVDGGTASAAEVVAAALQDRRRGVIVGSRTFGKGSVQEPITLSDGSAIELTVARYLTPDGRSLDGHGLTPDVTVPANAPDSVAITRASDVLTGLLADAASGRG